MKDSSHHALTAGGTVGRGAGLRDGEAAIRVPGEGLDSDPRAAGIALCGHKQGSDLSCNQTVKSRGRAMPTIASDRSELVGTVLAHKAERGW